MNIKDLPTKAEEKEIEIIIDGPNRTWAGILQNLYADCNSETSAALQYIYQSYIVEPKEEDIAFILEKIAMVEMHHHEELGKAIVKLGGVPYYINSQNRPLQMRCVNPTTNLKEILIADIKDEEIAIDNYTKAARVINNESIKQLLEHIKEDEIVHKKTLETILDYVSFYK